MTIIPDNFARTTIELYGDEGAAWLQRFVSRWRELCKGDSVELPEPLRQRHVGSARSASRLDARVGRRA